MSAEQFSSRGFIEKNMEAMKEKLIDEGTNQMVVLVVGKVNTAKTSLSLLIDNYLNDGEVNLDTYCLSHDKFKQEYTSRPLKKFIVYEEGRDSFDRNKHNHKSNTEARDILNQFRKYQHIVFINFQNVSDLQPELVNNNAHAMFRCVKKGWTHFYGRESMRAMWKNRYFQGWDDPDFKDGFPDPANELPELWESYEDKTLEALDSRGEEREEQDSGSSDEESDITYLSTKNAAEIIDVSNKTIRRWCNDGKLDHKRLPNGDRRIPKTEVYRVLTDGDGDEESGDE